MLHFLKSQILLGHWSKVGLFSHAHTFEITMLYAL